MLNQKQLSQKPKANQLKGPKDILTAKRKSLAVKSSNSLFLFQNSCDI